MTENPQAGVSRGTVVLVIATFAASIASLLVAPALMPDSYSLLLHGTSESAAQGVEGAWMARLGFLLLGFAVLWLAGVALPRWGRWASIAHRWFGVWMIAAAAFSTRPWVESAPFDPTEDLLHTVAASAMGIGFMRRAYSCPPIGHGPPSAGWRGRAAMRASMTSMRLASGTRLWHERSTVASRCASS